ncbi:MAG TPA: FtsX-like permease family protein [Rectinemataceae bacterium]
MDLFPFALRNLARNRRRSLLAALSVALSILMVVVLRGFADGFTDSLVRNYIKNETGHINIATAEYRDRARFMPVDAIIEDSEGLVSRISETLRSEIPGAIVAERFRFGALLSSDSGTKEALILAGTTETESKLLMLDSRILPGGRPIGGPGETIMGSSLAGDLGLRPGDRLKIVTQKSDGGLGFKSFSIVGLFGTGVNSLDGLVVQIGLDDARELLGAEGCAQQVSVVLPRRSALHPALESIRKALGAQGAAGQELSILPWTAIGEYPAMIRLMEVVYYWVYIFVAVLGAFIIANVMTMATLERKREIGILMAMGMPKKRIASIFLLEGSLLGFFGSAVGASLGLAINLVLSRKGLDMTGAMAGFSWPLDNVIYPAKGMDALALGILIGTLVSAAVAFFPAKKAAAMAPVEAIRGQS